MIERSFCLSLAVILSSATPGQSQRIDFDRDIRSILSDKCYQCHGPDAETREAGLRLDTKAGAFADRDGSVAFRPGKPDQSEAIKRIFSADPDERMPPPDSKLALSAAEKKRLRAWVAQGATWGEHWAFVTPTMPQPSPVRLKDWPKNDIDRFILARLEKAGLKPSAEADRETLIRRVSLDLTGLPPTPKEVDAFLKDTSADAYEKVVDRLLRSPAYGERMAWEWLDAARYADTDGFQGDPTRTMWPWRDWLISALNDNVPFDRFTIEMLAGDLLPDATADQIVATGFNRNHMYNGEGGRIAEETRVENVFDRNETTATVWLGLTLTCARCHDHKYDPVSQKEYYRLYAFFNNTSESGRGGGGKAPPVLNFRTPSQREQIKDFDRRIAELNRKMDAPMPDVDRAQADWEKKTAQRLAAASPSKKLTLGDWSVLGPLPAPDGNGAKSFAHDFGPEKAVDLKRTYAGGKTAWRVQKQFVDGKVHALPDTIGATYLYRTLEAPAVGSIDVSLGSDDGIRVWLNGKQVLSKNVARAAAADQEIGKWTLKKGKNDLLMKIVNTGGIAGFYFRAAKDVSGGLPPEVAKALLVAADKRNAAQQKSIRDAYRGLHSPAWKKLNDQRTAIGKQRDQLEKSGTTVMVMDQLPQNRRRKTTTLVRGIYNKPGDGVTAGTPAFLPPLPENAPRNRLTLARWLVSPANPLPARVTVNRYWQMFFGTGLVETSEDFGRQGDRPSHPQLLDWLAARFIQNGWDVKALHKQIVMSATYRQSSVFGDTSKDPDNRLLSRGARYRLPSWMLRDQAMAVGGLLVHRIGGPPVKPYQPPGVWAEATFGKIRYQQDKGEKLYRRSLYVFWRRIVGPTMFFDGGKRQTCEVKPTRTNTPLHALTTLNETTFVESSRAMAQRVMKTSRGTVEDRITYAFRLATARAPRPDELALLTARFKQIKAEFESQPQQAAKLLSVGESPRDTTLNAEEHAAYAVLCSLLLNLDETLSRE